MINYVILVTVAAIVGLAAAYIYRSKRKGVKCIGCPDSGTCSGQCGSCGGCSCH